MNKVIHLIPYDGIGGVETAARSMSNLSGSDFHFKVETIFPLVASGQRLSTFNPFLFFVALIKLWHEKPDVLILSLWRSCVVGLALKLLRPSTRLVLFLHLPNDVHKLDCIFTRLAACSAIRVWADSHETLARRLPALPADKGRVISFVTARIAELPAQSVRPVFIFWGRINTQKRLDRALHIFAEIHASLPVAQFWIVGPDGGDLANMRALVSKLNLESSVKFLGVMNFEDICHLAAGASFYLQTSQSEGMAMSVVEAMQLGLVPLVTPVGEIAHYARNGENAVVILKDCQAVTTVLNLLNDDARYREIRKSAIEVWVNKPLYKDDVILACIDVLTQDAH